MWVYSSLWERICFSCVFTLSYQGGEACLMGQCLETVGQGLPVSPGMLGKSALLQPHMSDRVSGPSGPHHAASCGRSWMWSLQATAHPSQFFMCWSRPRGGRWEVPFCPVFQSPWLFWFQIGWQSVSEMERINLGPGKTECIIQVLWLAPGKIVNIAKYVVGQLAFSLCTCIFSLPLLLSRKTLMLVIYTLKGIQVHVPSVPSGFVFEIQCSLQKLNAYYRSKASVVC